MYLYGCMAFDMPGKIEDNMGSGEGDNCPAVRGNTCCFFCLFIGQFSKNGGYVES